MLQSTAFLVTALLVNVILGANVCDDLDSNLCRTFGKDMDICNHPCLSGLCQRYCGKCPTLKCYNCHSTMAPEYCNQTTICQHETDFCVTTESFDDNFNTVIKLGCASKNTCVAAFGYTDSPPTTKMPTTLPIQTTTVPTTAMPTTQMPTTAMPTTGMPTTEMLTTITNAPSTKTYTTMPTDMPVTKTTEMPTDVFNVVGRRQVDHQMVKKAGLSGECCSTNLCNNYAPGQQPSVQTQTTVTQSGTTVLNNCLDVSQSGCYQLSKLKTSMCTDPCIASACPRTCGKCSECYTCNHVTRPEDCNQTSVCLAREQCYALATLNFDGEHGFKVGCMHEDVCSRFHVQAGSIFGRRSDPVELSLHGDCCSGDLCNHKELAPLVATTVPPACVTGTHHCPKDFHLIDGKCFLIGHTKQNFQDAQEFCKNHCSELTEHLSSTNIRAVVSFLLHDFSAFRGLDYIYIGAVDKYHTGLFTWLTSGQPVTANSRPHLYLGKYCGTLNVHTTAIHPVSCGDKYYPLCETQKR